MIKTIEIKEEEEEDKELEEKTSVENVFILEKWGTKHFNVPSAKEGLIEEHKVGLELCMLRKI